MSQVNTSVEVLLKIRQIGEELIAKTKRDMDALAATQGKAGAAAGKAAEGSAALSKSLASQDSLAIKLAEKFGRLAAGYLSFATARRAIAASNEAERAEARALGILQAQVDTREKAIEQLERLKRISRDVASRTGVLDDDAVLNALARVSATNPAFATERTATAIADLAFVKFGGNLEAATEAVADSLAGIGRGLQDVLPEIKALSTDDQQRLLKAGGAIGLIESRFGGSAGAFAATPAGQLAEAKRDFDDVLELVGGALKSVLAPAAVIAAKSLLAVAASGEQRSRAGLGVLGLFARGADSGVRTFDETILPQLLRAGIPGVPLRGAVGGLFENIANISDLAAGRAQRAPAAGAPLAASTNPNALLGADAVARLLGGSGALGSFEEKILELRRQFASIQTGKGEFPFEAPSGGLSASIANAERDIDLLYNLSLAREKAAQTAETLARAQEELNKSVARTSELVQTKSISEAAGRQANEEAAARFRAVVEQAKAAREETAEFSAETTAKLQQFTDVGLPAELRFITDLTDSVEAAERALETLNRRALGLSQELSKRLEQPFANLIVATAKGEAGLTDFAQTFADTLAQIAAEEASRGILRAIFGGISGATGIGSAFDALGAAFGFGGSYAQGGLVPGADRGRDTTFIAARGQEFVLTPGAARAIGHGRLDSINRAFGGRASRGPSYSGGGLVDVVAAMGGGAGGGASGGGGLTVLPVLPTDRATIESLFGGDNALVVAELLARNPSARRALSMGGAR